MIYTFTDPNANLGHWKILVEHQLLLNPDSQKILQNVLGLICISLSEQEYLLRLQRIQCVGE